MANLAIKGHATRGNEVIEILEMLGGKNERRFNGENNCLWHFINKRGEISVFTHVVDLTDNIFFTLEEFLEKFPYKVGDKVLVLANSNNVFTIKSMTWDTDQVKYKIKAIDDIENEFDWLADELLYYTEQKEEAMKEKRIDIPKGYEFAGVDDDRQQVVFTKVEYHYPQTYNECCKELGHPEVLLVDRILGYKGILLSIFQELLICRDAYWKIAGEQMGLGKPWKPDYTDKHKYKYSIWIDHDEIMTGGAFTTTQMVFTFPTEEMRDAFYVNFKDLIEGCKELL